MDINEVTGKLKYRHPWELSRTISVLREIYPILCRMNDNAKFLSIGAGDMYFDKHILRIKKQNAVDIGYDTDKIDLVKDKSNRIKMFGNLDKVGNEKFDYALMLDSLEYMSDDEDYLTQVSEHLENGGYLILTLPAYQLMYSDHDRIVGNLRRYSRQSLKRLINRISGVKIIDMHYFYHSLLIVRLIQKAFRVDIDPMHKVTTGWNYSENSYLTRVVVGVLNFDYFICMCLSKVGIFLPGLSLMAICKKV